MTAVENQQPPPTADDPDRCSAGRRGRHSGGTVRSDQRRLHGFHGSLVPVHRHAGRSGCAPVQLCQLQPAVSLSARRRHRAVRSQRRDQQWCLGAVRLHLCSLLSRQSLFPAPRETLVGQYLLCHRAVVQTAGNVLPACSSCSRPTGTGRLGRWPFWSPSTGLPDHAGAGPHRRTRPGQPAGYLSRADPHGRSGGERSSPLGNRERLACRPGTGRRRQTTPTFRFRATTTQLAGAQRLSGTRRREHLDPTRQLHV